MEQSPGVDQSAPYRDAESKQILGLEMTNEEASDSDTFSSLLEQSKAGSNGVKKVLRDGAYDDKHVFNLLKRLV